jgi:uncharacterized protein YjbI with pentapeptide repeats
MANPEHVAKLHEGIDVWNKWRHENPELYPDLCRLNLGGANLCRADLTRASFIDAHLVKTDLRFTYIISLVSGKVLYRVG